MRTVVVYYSLEGSTDLIAQRVAQKTGADIVRLTPKKEIPKGNFRKFFWGGKSVVFNEKPELANGIINVENYDTVVIGTPIWASSVAPPVMTFLAQNKIVGKNVYLFACHSGGGTTKCFEKLEKHLPGNTIKKHIDFIDPAKGKDNGMDGKIEQFTDAITNDQ